MQKGAVWILSVVLGAPGIAATQDVADAAYTADEITVFGSARDERRLLETPNAVTVIDEAEVQRRQPSTYEELIGDAPGVTIGGGPRGMAQEPNIRGFQNALAAATKEMGVVELNRLSLLPGFLFFVAGFVGGPLLIFCLRSAAVSSFG